ncbi:hypothetical protein IU459_27055 [Nocardia amamiensis]|uniref:Scaffolding protein n=1 Tax=Nocardia amamiensis TaxID=404578 RepID=A0ABS0CYE8_9NOCA|nr:hypothetical protein [Nocardia amamiensis]MBF6301175.1 hypothetical protein [Nocardia amamiensis]
MSDNPITQPAIPIVVGSAGAGGGGISSFPLAAPTPAAPPASPAPAPAASASTEPAAPANPAPPEPAAPKTPEEYEAVIKDLRKENAGWRTRLREAEPIIEAHNQAQEAAKTDIQRANDQAAQLKTDLDARTNELNVLRAAHKHGVLEEDFDLLGSGTPEELDARAARIAARYPSSAAPTPPPSDRPVEGLRPGASPTPPAPPDTSYPASWRPRDSERS